MLLIFIVGRITHFDCSKVATVLDTDCTKTTRVVMGLLQKSKLLDNGYHVYMDNYYSSPELCYELYMRSTFCCGTVRKNRKGLPIAVSEAKLAIRVMVYSDKMGLLWL